MKVAHARFHLSSPIPASVGGAIDSIRGPGGQNTALYAGVFVESHADSGTVARAPCGVAVNVVTVDTMFDKDVQRPFANHSRV